MIKLPINSGKANMQNKNCDYKTLAILTLYSNRQPQEDFLETGNKEMWRYIYRNKIIKYQDEICDLSQVTIKKFLEKVKKLSNLDSKIVNAKNTKNGICYDINYYGLGESKGYVVISDTILRKLIKIGDSKTIKIYILLKYICKQEYVCVTNEYICQQIGLSKKSHNNIQVVIDNIDILVKNNLILKSKEKCIEIITNSSNKKIEKYVEKNKYKIV